MKNLNAPCSIYIKAVTWSRDSHGLYDYESRSVQKKLIQTNESCCLYRTGTEIYQIDSYSELKSPVDSSVLCYIEQEFTEYNIKPHTEPLWIVVRTLKTKYGPGYILKEGDVVKLGRVCFKVSHLTSQSTRVPSENTQDSDESDCEIPNERENSICRICLSNDSDSSNPLISPCSCSGSMKHIHLICLQQWIASRMVSKNTENCITYSWKSIDCEICKSSLPFSLGSTGKDIDLFKIEKPNSPFIVLQGLSSDRNSNRGVYVINVTSTNNIVLGRGHDADVRISDISVSRSHALIKFKNGHFVLEDNNSKFGTLIKHNGKLTVTGTSSTVVQIGRTVISISTKAPNSVFDIPEISN